MQDSLINKDEKLITTNDLCEWLKISRATACRWRTKGMPYFGRERSLRYKISEITKWLNDQKKE